MAVGPTVDTELREGELIVERTHAPHYDLDDLLAGIETARKNRDRHACRTGDLGRLRLRPTSM